MGVRTGWAVAALLVMAIARPAGAQMDSREGIALQNQILELRRDLQIMQGQRGSSLPPSIRSGNATAPGSEIAAQLLDRVQTLEEEVRRLRGQLDEQSNATRRRLDEIAKRQAEAAFQVQNPVAPVAPITAPPARLDPPPSQGGTGRRPPELAMQEGNAALARRDYSAAEAAAREVLGGARSPRTIDAQFLLAQALYGRRDYAGSAVAFDDSYTAARSGTRAPDALVGLANALTGLNDTRSACQALDRLRAEFPNPRADVRAAAAAARGRAVCR